MSIYPTCLIVTKPLRRAARWRAVRRFALDFVVWMLVWAALYGWWVAT